MDVSKPRNNKYVIFLTLASCLILVVGWRARPGELSQSAPTLPSENELAQLGRRGERRSLESTTSYFASVADQVDSSVVYVPGAGASGVLWDASLIVTAPLQADAVVSPVGSRPNPVAEHVIVGGPHLPLAIIRAAEGQGGSSPAQLAPSAGEPGDWLVAVWRTERQRAFAATTFLQPAPVRCGVSQLEEVVSTLSFTPAMAGGGLFDLDGRLLGVILPCGPRFAAISVAGVQAVLDGSQTVEQRLLSLYGLALGPLTEPEKLHFKRPGGAPASTLMVVRECDSAGPLTDNLLGIIAVNNLLCITTYGLASRARCRRATIPWIVAAGTGGAGGGADAGRGPPLSGICNRRDDGGARVGGCFRSDRSHEHAVRPRAGW